METNTSSNNLNVKLSEVPDSKPTYVPKSTYWHRIKEAEFKMSKASNNPMYELTVEIVDHAGLPDPKTGEIVDLNGTEAMMWCSLTEKGLGNLKKFFKACNLPLEVTLTDLINNPNPAFLKGKKFLAVGYSKPDVQMDELTKTPIRNPVTGQDLIYYTYKVGDLFPQSS